VEKSGKVGGKNQSTLQCSVVLASNLLFFRKIIYAENIFIQICIKRL